MIEICFQKKRGNFVFVIQLFEFLLAFVLLIISFTIAGQLVYYDCFPFGFAEGMIFFAIASTLATILLISWKYFNFFNQSFAAVIYKSVGAVILQNIILVILLYFRVDSKLSPYYFILSAFIQILFLLIVKFLSGLAKRRILRNKSSLIICKAKEKSRLKRAFKKQGYHLLDFISLEETNITSYIDKADFVYLMASASKELKKSTVSYCTLNRKRLFVIPEIHEIAMLNAEMTQIDDVPLLTVESFQLNEAQFAIKRIMDIIISLTGIILTAPILLTAALMIKKEDNGPVFFTQIRSGLNGKEFKMIKLRSMIIDAEKDTGAVLASEKDDRITKIGNFIRLTRIDEIPQFFNVLQGSMSIVGPRPERPVFVEKYIKEYPEYIHRMAVKPGITGLAQVMAKYTTSVENKLKYDLLYVKNYSPVFDIRIILRTIKTVLTKDQAKGVPLEEISRGKANTNRREVCEVIEGQNKQKKEGQRR